MKVTIKMLKGGALDHEYLETTTFAAIATDIEEKKDIKVSKLIYLGKIMEADKTLAEVSYDASKFLVCMGAPKPAAVPTPAAAPVPAPLATPVLAPIPASTASPSMAASPETPAPATSGATLVAPGAPAPAAPAGGPGQPTAENIAQLMEMGFPEDQCTAALRAAFNDTERATQFLLEGIPEGATQMQAPAAPEGAPAGSNSLEALRQHPQFEQLRAQLQADPSSLPQVLQGFGASNPAVAQAIEANLPAFIAMMQEPALPVAPVASAGMPGVPAMPGGMPSMPGVPAMPGGMPNPQQMLQMLQMVNGLPEEQRNALLQATGLNAEQLQQLQQMAPMLQQATQQGGGMPPGPRPGQIQLTQDEVDAVERLAELGFEKHDCLQAYMACDKNFELAANFLLTNPPEPMDLEPPAGSPPPGGQ